MSRGGRVARSSRRTYGGAGLASHSGVNECSRCGLDIEDWTQATKANGRWIHKSCRSGADDE